MPKLRKIAGTGHIIGRAPKPRFTCLAKMFTCWAGLEAAFGTEFDGPTRTAILKAVGRYTDDVRLDEDAYKRANLRGRIDSDAKGGKQHKSTALTKLERARAAFASALRKALADEAAFPVLAELKGIDLDALMVDVGTLGYVLRLAQARVADDLHPPRDKSGRTAFDRLVVNLANILEAAGEPVTVHGGVYDECGRLSAFQSFVWRLNKPLPHSEPFQGDKACASRVARALLTR